MVKSLLLKGFREGVGGLMAGVSFITTGGIVKRSPEEQMKVNEAVQHLSIYQYFACPFCIKTRRTVRRLSLPMEYRDAQIRGGEHRNTLEKEGGKIQVPCLRIDDGDKTTWLYESDAIVDYLNQHFGSSK